jgi:hypothetical protein
MYREIPCIQAERRENINQINLLQMQGEKVPHDCSPSCLQFSLLNPGMVFAKLN